MNKDDYTKLRITDFVTVFLNIIQNYIKRSIPLLIDRSGNDAIQRFQRIDCALTSTVCGFFI